MNATQLKDILEHAYGGASATGAVNGKFAQISGMKVTYDSSRTARSTVVTAVNTGDRIRRVVLDDGTVLIDNGVVVNPTRSFSFTTIDFTANGGDNYPFAVNGVAFENDPFTITYQEALANFIKAPKAIGGLQRVNAADGDEITVNMYGEENAFDLHGRLIDVNVGVAVSGQVKNGTAGRDTLVGTAGDDIIVGGIGADTLTGGAGGDKFVYGSLRDAGDTITDFTPYADTIQLGGLLAGLGCASGSGCDAVADGYVRVVDVIGGVSLQIDPDGAAGPATARPLVTLKGLTARQFVPARDLGL
jgi:5'-nucleotidase